MQALIGNDIWVFIGMTVVIGGGAAFLIGQALASTWRSIWLTVFYTALLTCAERFLVFALFDGVLLSVPGYLVDGAVLMVIALLAHRTTQTRKMVNQYPWLYEAAGPFTWRERRQ